MEICRCTYKKDFDDLMDILHRRGYVWVNGITLKELNFWNMYKENTHVGVFQKELKVVCLSEEDCLLYYPETEIVEYRRFYLSNFEGDENSVPNYPNAKETLHKGGEIPMDSNQVYIKNLFEEYRKGNLQDAYELENRILQILQILPVEPVVLIPDFMAQVLDYYFENIEDKCKVLDEFNHDVENQNVPQSVYNYYKSNRAKVIKAILGKYSVHEKLYRIYLPGLGYITDSPDEPLTDNKEEALVGTESFFKLTLHENFLPFAEEVEETYSLEG